MKLWTLTKRHIKTYLRDKVSVFFSLLSVIILLAIYLLFLGKMFGDLEGLSKIDASRFTNGYIMGGVLVVSTITLSLGVLGVYVTDIEKNKMNGFLVSPVKRQTLTISYYLATVIVTFLLTTLMFILSFLYLGITGHYWYSIVTILQSIGVIAIYSLISISLMVFAVSYVKTSNAFGALSSIVGTLIGFIAGIYIPLSVFDVVTKTVASLMPFSHMTIFFRRLLIGSDLLDKIPQEAIKESGIEYLKFAGINLNIYVILSIFVGISMLFLVFSYLRMNKKSK